MTRYYDFLTAYENLLRDEWKERTNVKATCSDVTINTWEPKANQVTMLAREVNGRQVVHLLNFTQEDGATNLSPLGEAEGANYMLCWHDNQAIRPWPQRFENLSIRLTGLTGMGKVRRIWVASPDYCGGAMQELTDYRYTSSTGTISLTLPSLQFWTMIVIEPETATTKDNTCYAPATNGESLVPDIPSSLAATTSATRSWNLTSGEAIFEAHADIPAGTLTLSRDNDDAIILPLGESREVFYDLGGRQIVNGKWSNGKLPHGIVISQDKKVLR